MSKEDGDWTESDEEDWTEADDQLYSQQVLSSDGFDVEIPVGKGNSLFGLIGPMNFRDESVLKYNAVAEAAVKAYNEFKERKTGELQLVKIQKCMGQLCAIMNYFMTFEAKDLSNGDVGIYQAIIFENVQRKMKVMSFRRKPTDEEIAANLPKEWVWHTKF